MLSEEVVSIVADFCFPTGIPVTLIKFDKNTGEGDLEVINEVLFKSTSTIREDMFTFSLEANDEDNADPHLYVLCCPFADLARVGNSLFRVERSLCLVTVNQQYFPYLEEVLAETLNSLKNLRIEQYMKMMTQKYTFSPEIDGILAVKVEDAINLRDQKLQNVYAMDVNTFGGPGKEYPFEFDNFNEFYWHCCHFFTLLQ